MRYVSAIPAYGRDYKSKAEVMADWDGGADFRVQDVELSGYVSIRDKPADVTLNIRYKNQTQICVVT